MAWEIRAPAQRPHGSQFAYGLRGACTLLAMAACQVITQRTTTTPTALQATMKAIYDLARKYGDCAANGAANQVGMLDVAARLGMPVAAKLAYQEMLPEDTWLPFLRKYAGGDSPCPILVQVANGQALRDAETGAQDERGLQYHAICIYGTQTDPANPAAGGYICADGDNPGANQHPAVYNLATLRTAQPVSMVAFAIAPPLIPKPAPAPAPPTPAPPPPPADTAIDIAPSVIADLEKSLASATALLNQVAAALASAKHLA